jgi:beta-phosphoglucomutase-like phosphatase (HAD superfamily)
VKIIKGTDRGHTCRINAFVEIALERLVFAPTPCLVIEESVRIVAARAAGCFSAGLTTSFSEASLREAGADIVVGSYLTARETNGVEYF